MKNFIRMFIIGLVIKTSAFAFIATDDEDDFISDLGAVMASEKSCSFVFDHNVILKLIETSIRPESTVVLRSLKSEIEYNERKFEGSNKFVQKAICLQARRVANSLGFLNDQTVEEKAELKQRQEVIKSLMSEEYEPVLITNLVHNFAAEELCGINYKKSFINEWAFIKELKKDTDFLKKFNSQLAKYTELMRKDATFCEYKIRTYTEAGIVESVD